MKGLNRHCLAEKNSFSKWCILLLNYVTISLNGNGSLTKFKGLGGIYASWKICQSFCCASFDTVVNERRTKNQLLKNLSDIWGQFFKSWFRFSGLFCLQHLVVEIIVFLIKLLVDWNFPHCNSTKVIFQGKCELSNAVLHLIIQFWVKRRAKLFFFL